MTNCIYILIFSSFQIYKFHSFILQNDRFCWSTHWLVYFVRFYDLWMLWCYHNIDVMIVIKSFSTKKDHFLLWNSFLSIIWLFRRTSDQLFPIILWNHGFNIQVNCTRGNIKSLVLFWVAEKIALAASALIFVIFCSVWQINCLFSKLVWQWF